MWTLRVLGVVLSIYEQSVSCLSHSSQSCLGICFNFFMEESERQFQSSFTVLMTFKLH